MIKDNIKINLQTNNSKELVEESQSTENISVMPDLTNQYVIRKSYFFLFWALLSNLIYFPTTIPTPDGCLIKYFHSAIIGARVGKFSLR